MKEEVDELIKQLDNVLAKLEKVTSENTRLKQEKEELLNRIYTLTERK